ncbi:MAG: adenylate/guanylate cyclase domain-containing protein, partial [Actinomycetota bacterium]
METPGGMVALLFTDQVGSTSLLERLGEDVAEELRRSHFSLLRRAVMEAGGHEVKNLGDGLMVSFPSSVQAVRCAVSIQRRIAKHNRAKPERALQVRIGLHVGEPLAEDKDLFGTAVVVTKRLCDQAEGGQILASELVASMVGSREGFRFRPVGRIALKGLAQPVSAVAVDWQTSGLASSTPPTGPRSRLDAPWGPGLVGKNVLSVHAVRWKTPLVGRTAEVAALQAEVYKASRQFRCVLLVGDPGMGKTRLAAELLARHGRTRLALSGRGFPLGATSSFGLWAEALEYHLRQLPPEQRLRLSGGFGDDLASVLGSVAAARVAVPETVPPRHRLLEALAHLLSELARQRPVVAVLDDVHHADASSWEALSYA